MTSYISPPRRDSRITTNKKMEVTTTLVKGGGDNDVSTFHSMFYGRDFFIKVACNRFGVDKLAREAHVASTISCMPELSALFCSFWTADDGSLITMGVPGECVYRLSDTVKRSETFRKELKRVLDVFDRHDFAHGDLHGNNVFYDAGACRIWVIDVGQSQFRSDPGTWYSTWLEYAPKEFTRSIGCKHAFFRALDIVVSWYAVAVGLSEDDDDDDTEGVFQRLEDLVEKNYGIVVRFDPSIAKFHEKIVSAVVRSITWPETTGSKRRRGSR